jgi:hypothetical protein
MLDRVSDIYRYFAYFFAQHSPPASWIESEDRDDGFLNEMNYIIPNLNEIAGE